MRTDRNDYSQFFERVRKSINTQKQNTKQTKQNKDDRAGKQCKRSAGANSA
jgi:hypothetical protein